MLADDNELNKWYPLGKLTKIQPEAVQKFEAKIYKRKAKDVELKKKLLPSIFKEEYVMIFINLFSIKHFRTQQLYYCATLFFYYPNIFI